LSEDVSNSPLMTVRGKKDTHTHEIWLIPLSGPKWDSGCTQMTKTFDNSGGFIHIFCYNHNWPL